MFTGIIEVLGIVQSIRQEGSNKHFIIESPISSQLKIDQSVSHDGVCLTVVKVDGGSHTVTAIDETLQKSNLGKLKQGDAINLERCMLANGRFDGTLFKAMLIKQVQLNPLRKPTAVGCLILNTTLHWET
jgi:riboflavin synthase